MIVKFHARGKGGGSGPVDYLLGPARDREGARVLRGDPGEVRELIDATPFAKKYTSGVLSFAEKSLPPGGREKVMESFERVLMPGLEKNQYSVLWVEHQDKGRLELNFVIPNMELQTGKRLQPYYDPADRPRVDAWQTLVNHHYALHDPNAPENRRTLVTPGNLPESKQKAAEAITGGLEFLCLSGDIKNRQDVIQALKAVGFDVVRTTKSSISLADPEGGRNLRLKGAIYEQSFENGVGLESGIKRAGERYRENAEQRVQQAREFCKKGCDLRRGENQRRYPQSHGLSDGLTGGAPSVDSLGDGNRIAGPAAARREEVLRDDIVRAGFLPDVLGCAGVSGREDGAEPEKSGCAGVKTSATERENSDAGERADEREGLGAGVPGGEGRSVPGAAGQTERNTDPAGREAGGETEGVTGYDGAGTTLTERIRAVTAGLYAAAERLGGRLRGIAEDVYAYATGERAAERAGHSVESACTDALRAGEAAERADRKTEQLIRNEELIREIPERGKTLEDREYGD